MLPTKLPYKRWWEHKAGGTLNMNSHPIMNLLSLNNLHFATKYADLATAVSTIGATETTLVIEEAEAITEDLTIPATMSLLFLRGGEISVANTKTLTITGPPEIGLFPVFTGDGTVVFSSGAVDVLYPEWWGTDNDTTSIQAANDAANGGVVFLSQASYSVSSLTIDNCTLTGRSQQGTTITVTGTISVVGTSWAVCGRLHDVTIATAASGYTNTAVKVTGFVNRQHQVLNNVMISADGFSVEAGSKGLYLEADATDVGTKAIASSSFGPIIVEGYEYGVKVYATQTSGSAYINGNVFESLKIFESKYLIRMEEGGAAQVIANIFSDLVLQAGDATVDGFTGIEIQGTQVVYTVWDWSKASGTPLILNSGSYYNIMTGYGADVVDSGDENRIIPLRTTTARLTLRDNAYGDVYYEGIAVNQPTASQYLLLARKLSAHAISGTIVGRRASGSSAGENSARIFINILSDNTPNTYRYWEIDYKTVAVNIVELTYDGDVWIALDAVETGSTRPLEYAVFQGQYSAESGQLGWVVAGDVSGVTAVFGSRTIRNSQTLFGSVVWDPAEIAVGAMEATDVTVTGAATGDWAVVSFSQDVLDLVLNAQVTSSNTVTCVLANNTAGAVNLPSGTLYVKVMRR